MHTEHALRFPGTTAGFHDAATALRLILDARALHPRVRHDIELVFDEVVTNIVTHGQPSGDVDVRIRLGDETTMVFEDDAAAFDPRLQPAQPAPPRPADLRIGGLGIVIVRELCAHVDYVRTPEQRNRLTLRLRAVDRDVDPTGDVRARR